jgi:hypothetical protein
MSMIVSARSAPSGLQRAGGSQCQTARREAIDGVSEIVQSRRVVEDGAAVLRRARVTRGIAEISRSCRLHPA